MAADPSKCFQYNFALVSRVATSFAEESSYDLVKGQTIDIDKARLEHEALVDALRRIGVDVVELPCDERHPDGLFVDDIAVVVNGTALICNPPSIKDRPSRQGEVGGPVDHFDCETCAVTVFVTKSIGMNWRRLKSSRSLNGLGN